ncbi:MAG: hypothetical protein AVDCRST_MAG30-1125, partial [uncultured Solirubrobacteraceae bacterium]
ARPARPLRRLRRHAGRGCPARPRGPAGRQRGRRGPRPRQEGPQLPRPARRGQRPAPPGLRAALHGAVRRDAHAERRAGRRGRPRRGRRPAGRRGELGGRGPLHRGAGGDRHLPRPPREVRHGRAAVPRAPRRGGQGPRGPRRRPREPRPEVPAAEASDPGAAPSGRDPAAAGLADGPWPVPGLRDREGPRLRPVQQVVGPPRGVPPALLALRHGRRLAARLAPGVARLLVAAPRQADPPRLHVPRAGARSPRVRRADPDLPPPPGQERQARRVADDPRLAHPRPEVLLGELPAGRRAREGAPAFPISQAGQRQLGRGGAAVHAAVAGAPRRDAHRRGRRQLVRRARGRADGHGRARRHGPLELRRQGPAQRVRRQGPGALRVPRAPHGELRAAADHQGHLPAAVHDSRRRRPADARGGEV